VLQQVQLDQSIAKKKSMLIVGIYVDD